MPETVLHGNLTVVPREEGGRHLVSIDGPNSLYRIPLTPDEVKALIAMLQLSDEEMAARQAQAEARQKLIVPEGTLPGGPNGRQ